MSEDNCPGVVWLVAAKRPCACPFAPSAQLSDRQSIWEGSPEKLFDMDIRGDCYCWRFVGRDRRFSNHAHFDVRIHDGLKTLPFHRTHVDIGLD